MARIIKKQMFRTGETEINSPCTDCTERDTEENGVILTYNQTKNGCLDSAPLIKDVLFAALEMCGVSRGNLIASWDEAADNEDRAMSQGHGEYSANCNRMAEDILTAMENATELEV